MTPEQYAKFADDLAAALKSRGWGWATALEAAARITAEVARTKGVDSYWANTNR